MTIIEALVQLRDDLKLWVINNLRMKVDKEDGKGLSSNDYTTEEKEKLAGLSTDLGQGYGVCTTAAATAEKVVTMSNYALVVDGVVAVKFTYAVPANSTMNINGKGAKDIYHRGVKITANVIQAGDTATFIYDGTQYQLMSIDKTYALFSSDTSPTATGVINWTYG